jgi:sugar phosphate isomerase/epimerase
MRFYPAAGARGISIWRNVIEGRDLGATARQLNDAGLTPVSLVRGGFFTAASESERQAAIDENKRVIDEAEALGSPLVVLVCGATPGISITANLAQIQTGIEALLPHAEAAGVKLGIEPLHPMYADTRSAVCDMRTANDMTESIDSPWVGVTVDVFHLWWDPRLENEIARCGAGGNLLSFHVCDWKEPLQDMLNDRALMGEGLIDVKGFRGWVEDAGFDGFIEVEIFSNRWWACDAHDYLAAIVEAYKTAT